MAANDLRVHFGLGDASEITDVTVTWVDGSKADFGSFKRGIHTLTKKQ
jgi:hypothetical protein